MTMLENQPMQCPPEIPAAIFRAYDIRGIVDTELNPAAVACIAQAIGSEALDNGIDTLLIGCDGRLSSPALCEALEQGLRRSGCDVVNLGMVPTPLLYFATHTSGVDSAVMLTASHNPSNYNGLKIVFRRTCLADNQIQTIRRRIDAGELREGAGSLSTLDLRAAYIERVVSDIALARPMKIVLDCGNAVPGSIAPELFRALGCEVIPLFCDIDGRFPNHHPDPTIAANLAALSAEVRRQQADLGLAFDGDGDRLGMVDEQGGFIDADRILAVLVRDIAPRYPGEPIIFDVKCSRHLQRIIADAGAVPVMHRSGHSFMKQKMQQTAAPLGGEYAAHIFIKDRWYGYDDGLYAAARLLEVLSRSDAPASRQCNSFGDVLATPEIKLPVPEARKFALMQALQDQVDFAGAEIIRIDGIRAEFPHGWGLVRASNTSPALLLRFEADNLRALREIQGQFQALLRRVDASLELDMDEIDGATPGLATHG